MECPHAGFAFELSLNTNGLKALRSFQYGTFICVEHQWPFKGQSQRDTFLSESWVSSLWFLH